MQNAECPCAGNSTRITFVRLRVWLKTLVSHLRVLCFTRWKKLEVKALCILCEAEHKHHWGRRKQPKAATFIIFKTKKWLNYVFPFLLFIIKQLLFWRDDFRRLKGDIDCGKGAKKKEKANQKHVSTLHPKL